MPVRTRSTPAPLLPIDTGMFARLIALASAAFAAGCTSHAQPVAQAVPDGAVDGAEWAARCGDWDDWDKPGPPFRIHGESYYVGTCGIAAILIPGAQGHVLIDTGTEAGARVVMDNIRALGFDPADVRLLLTSHEHYDHVGGLAALQDKSGAAVVTSPAAVEVLRTGRDAAEDPQHGMHPVMRPADPVRAIVPGQPVRSGTGGTAITPVETPGHTPGALTWQWQSCDRPGDCLTIVYADSLSPVSADSYRFSDHSEYLRAYRAGIARLAALDCDILLTPHPSASGLREKLLADDLAGGINCRDYAASIAQRLDARLAQEAGQ